MQDLFGDVPAPQPRARKPQAPVARPTHTWFFALRPDAADATRIDGVASQLLASHGVSGKRVGPERLHVSLDAVGHDVDEATVDAACLAASTVRLPAFAVRFDAAASFASPGNPFVLLGDAGLEAVRHLRFTLGCAMADQGFAPARSYEPHMTLSYDPRQRVARTPVAPVVFRATGFSLVKSHIGFSRHEVLRTWPLAGGSGGAGG